MRVVLSFVMVLSLSTILSAAEDERSTQPAAVPVGVTDTETGVRLWEIELAVIDETNAHRARYGLPPLKVDATLVTWSRQHTWYMANSGAFHHGSYPCCENIAMGQRDHREVLQSWMSSSGHFANIIRFRRGRIGVAAYQRNGMIYWTQQFAADDEPEASVTQPSTQPTSSGNG